MKMEIQGHFYEAGIGSFGLFNPPGTIEKFVQGMDGGISIEIILVMMDQPLQPMIVVFSPVNNNIKNLNASNGDD